MKRTHFILIIILLVSSVVTAAEKEQVFKGYDLGNGSYKLWFVGGDKEDGNEDFVISDSKVLTQIKSKFKLTQIPIGELCPPAYDLYITQNDSIIERGQLILEPHCLSLTLGSKDYILPSELTTFFKKNKDSEIKYRTIKKLNVSIAREKLDSLSAISGNKLLFKSVDWYHFNGRIFLSQLKYDSQKIGLKDEDSLVNDMATRVKSFNPNINFKIETLFKFPSRGMPYFLYSYNIYLDLEKEEKYTELMNHLLEGEDPAKKSSYKMLPKVVDVGYYEIVGSE